jgi:hypothetical protein
MYILNNNWVIFMNYFIIFLLFFVILIGCGDVENNKLTPEELCESNGGNLIYLEPDNMVCPIGTQEIELPLVDCYCKCCK